MQIQLLYFHSIHLLLAVSENTVCIPGKTHAPTLLLLQLQVQEADFMFSSQHAKEHVLGPGQAPHRVGEVSVEPQQGPTSHSQEVPSFSARS